MLDWAHLSFLSLPSESRRQRLTHVPREKAPKDSAPSPLPHWAHHHFPNSFPLSPPHSAISREMFLRVLPSGPSAWSVWTAPLPGVWGLTGLATFLTDAFSFVLTIRQPWLLPIPTIVLIDHWISWYQSSDCFFIVCFCSEVEILAKTATLSLLVQHLDHFQECSLCSVKI